MATSSSFGQRVASVFAPAPPDGSPRPATYAIFDGARDETIYRAVYDSKLEYECLFAGELSYELALAAPYLVKLHEAAPLARWLLEDGWENSVGIVAWSLDDLEGLRRHFRRLLRVKDHAGKKLYFRFYDPRVLRVFLPTCRAPELTEVFGPVGRFVVAGSKGEVVGYERGGRPLRILEQPGLEPASLASADG